MSFKRGFKFTLKLVIVLGILGGIGYWAYKKISASQDTEVHFRSVMVKPGTITVSISASGTVEPEKLVDVGAQVAGLIVEFGLDENGNPVDYGSPVKAGNVLAHIDDSLYAAELKQNEARVLQAQAAIVSSEAELQQQRAKLELAEINWKRAQTLYKSHAIAEADYDNAKSVFHTAEAAVAVSQASILQAKAELASAEAQRDYAKRNLGYCVITSPVDGIIIDRRVNIGQTVVSSMSAPSLFLIAKDLSKMQVWVSVNEADIGRIQPGQDVEFTVDAFPQDRFVGTVGKIRLNASLSSNVVSYIVEVNTDNSSNRLLPYLTANVSFIEARRENALRLPSAALRYIPPEVLVAEADLKYLPDTSATAVPPGTRTEGVVWVLDTAANEINAVPVKLGAFDGIYYEVLNGVKDGEQVVTGIEVAAAAASEEETNPFLPKFPKRRR